MKVFVFSTDFLTDWSDGLGVILADNRDQAIEKMAKLVSPHSDREPGLIKEFKALHIDEYTLEEFPGVYTYGGA